MRVPVSRVTSQPTKRVRSSTCWATVLLDTIKEDFYFTGWSMRAFMRLFVALAPLGRFATAWIDGSADGATSMKEL